MLTTPHAAFHVASPAAPTSWSPLRRRIGPLAAVHPNRASAAECQARTVTPGPPVGATDHTAASVALDHEKAFRASDGVLPGPAALSPIAPVSSVTRPSKP